MKKSLILINQIHDPEFIGIRNNHIEVLLKGYNYWFQDGDIIEIIDKDSWKKIIVSKQNGINKKQTSFLNRLLGLENFRYNKVKL